MVSDDHDEHVRRALAVALVVVLTYKKWFRARTLAEWALVLGMLEDIEATEEEEGEDDGGPCAERARQVYPRSDFSRAPWSIMLRKAELKRCDSREARNFCRHFRIPYEFFLELVQLVKNLMWFWFAATDVAERQYIPVELKDSRSCI